MSEESKKYKVEVKKLPKSEVEIKGEIEAPLLDEARKKAIIKFSNELDLAGFRKGHVPEKVVRERVGEGKLLEEAADILLNEFYPKIISENNLDTIGRPKVAITKLALGNPLEFTLITAVLPDFELPDYKKIAGEFRSINYELSKEVEEKEVEDVLLQIRKNKAHHDFHKNNPDTKDHNHPDFNNEENLPILDDEFAKQAGKFENLTELRQKVKENIIAEKKYREIEKRRVAMIDAILSKTEIDLPEILVESEIEKSLAQLKDEIKRVGGKFEDYLCEIKKSDSSAEALAKAEDNLKNDLRAGAEKKAKIQLVFNKIAEIEKLEPNKEILEHEVKQILEHYPTASEQNARIYVVTQLLNQEVLKLLENS